MAISLTDDEKYTLCKAFGWFITDLDEQLTYVSEHITTDMNTALKADIALIKADLLKRHISINPTEANFGARVQLSKKASDLVKDVASMLAIPHSELNMAGGGSMVRG